MSDQHTPDRVHDEINEEFLTFDFEENDLGNEEYVEENAVEHRVGGVEQIDEPRELSLETLLAYRDMQTWFNNVKEKQEKEDNIAKLPSLRELREGKSLRPIYPDGEAKDHKVEDSCPICYQTYSTNSKDEDRDIEKAEDKHSVLDTSAVETTCGHRFHKQCLLTALETST